MWKNLRRTPGRDRTISKYVLTQWRRFLDDGHPPCKLMMRDCQFRLTENDRGDDPSAGEAHSGGSSADHPAAPWAESVRRLGEQDGADRSLAHADHTHREVFCTLCFCMWHDISRTLQKMMLMIGLVLLSILSIQHKAVWCYSFQKIASLPAWCPVFAPHSKWLFLLWSNSWL